MSSELKAAIEASKPTVAYSVIIRPLLALAVLCQEAFYALLLDFNKRINASYHKSNNLGSTVTAADS